MAEESNDFASMRKALLGWFDSNKRDLPWRKDKTPYRVWISEIMLQQTRVDSVIEYYNRWMEKFPSLESVAFADEKEILQAWEGLGYYSRARSIKKTADIIANDLCGIFPENPTELEKLPGIGKYTAGAICSIMFNRPVPALDGNIRRIFTRLFDISGEVRTPKTENELWKIAAEFLNTDAPGKHNEALMELGALVCLPTSPKCDICPALFGCLAVKNETVEERPVVKKKAPIPHYLVTAALICDQLERYLITHRPENGLLGGLWEFPGGKVEPGETLTECVKREIMEELSMRVEPDSESFGVYQHAYTHFRVTLYAFRCRCIGETEPVLNVAQAFVWASKKYLSN